MIWASFSLVVTALYGALILNQPDAAQQLGPYYIVVVLGLWFVGRYPQRDKD